MKEITFAIILIFILASCSEIKPKEYYSVKGKLENFDGTVYLTRAVSDKYYLGNFAKDSTLVRDGEFEFKLSNKIKSPLPFYLITEKIRTSRFLLEPKDQQIIIDSLYQNVSPIISRENSTISNEEQILNDRMSLASEKFKTEFKRINSQNFPKDSIEKYSINARDKFSFESNQILTNFTKDYPNSFVSFWEIAIGITYVGNNKELESAYNNLSDSIKQFEVSSVLATYMLEAKKLHIGGLFPEMKLKDRELNKFVFKANENSNADYTLVDFWFSFCSPCIAQFPKLKELESKYSPKQLKIISVSTDNTKHIENWYKVMEQMNLTWLNFLDENRTISSALGINTFPTNYLLNKDGIIIKKNIALKDLEELLTKSELTLSDK